MLKISVFFFCEQWNLFQTYFNTLRTTSHAACLVVMLRGASLISRKLMSFFVFLVCSGDELLLTEMIFNGVFNDLTVQQCVALLSCFVFEEKVNCRVSRKVMFNSPCNLASVKLFKAVYLHCVTHEKMFVGNVLLNRWLLFVNVYAFGCRLQGQTFNPLNYFFGRATFF